MCTSPITIKNKRTRFIPCVDREFISVPCGKCLECRNARRNELYILSYFEHLQAVSNCGFTQFFTLTYSDTFVPKFEIISKFTLAGSINIHKVLFYILRREAITTIKLRYKGIRVGKSKELSKTTIRDSLQMLEV